MSVGAFTDKRHPPSSKEIESGVGSCRDVWRDLNLTIRQGYGSASELKYYGKNYGWALRYRKGSKALVSLYPGVGSFTAQIILSESQVERARTTKLGKRVLGSIEAAHPFPEGRWLFLPVKTARDLQDVKKLLAIKSPPHEADVALAGSARSASRGRKS